jgi:hypothetical protein
MKVFLISAAMLVFWSVCAVFIAKRIKKGD